MHRKPLLWHLLPACVVSASAAILACVIYTHSAWQEWALRSGIGRSHDIAQAGADIALRSLSLSVVVIFLAGLIVYIAVRRVSKSIDEVQRGARRFADGDLGFRLPAHSSSELGTMAETLNRMAAQLDERIRTIETQRNERDAMLTTMEEGVIALDAGDKVHLLNRAATGLLGLSATSCAGRDLAEIVRNIDLLRLVQHCRRVRKTVEQEIVVYGQRDVYLQARCSPLHPDAPTGSGTLIVLNDITRLRRLESVRREFVANVSHELRTPLTSIRGFVETLQGGAMNEPEEANRFLGIIHRQVHRLQSVIDDLLSLSRIEQDVDREQLHLQDGSVREVLAAAIQTVAPAARAKHIQIHLDCPDHVRARMHAPLLEQAAINLLDNAVKYSESHRDIHVLVLQENGQWILRFKDSGPGIEAQHLPRIFERFYRIDKARSRKMGGTGLGLSIVKHIVLAHGGRVDVASTPGTGSVFSIVLPATR